MVEIFHEKQRHIIFLRSFCVALVLFGFGCNGPKGGLPTRAPFNSEETANALHEARILESSQKYAAAEAAYRTALKKATHTEGVNSAAYAVVLDELGIVYLKQGRYTEAQRALERSLTVFTKFAPWDRLEFADALNNLGALYFDEAQYSKAQELFEQAVSFWESSLAFSQPRVLTGLNNFAALLRSEGQVAESEQLLRTALSQERGMTSDSDGAGDSERRAESAEAEVKTLSTLGLVLSNDEKRYAEAEPLLREALRVAEAHFGKDDLRTAEPIARLGLLHDDTKRFDAAEAELKRALSIDKSLLGEDDQETAQTEYYLGRLLLHSGRCRDATTWLTESVSVRQKILGANHPDVGVALCRLAASLACTGPDHFEEAADDYERVRHIVVAASRSNLELDDELVAGIREHNSPPLEEYVPLLAEIVNLHPSKRKEATSTAFSVADQLRSGSADAALSKVAIRRLTSKAETLNSFSRVQELRIQVQNTRKEFLSESRGESSTGESASRINALSLRLHSLEQELDSKSAELFKEFPEYAELLAPTAITPSELQPLLDSAETLVAYYALEERLEIWVVPSRGPVSWSEVPIKRGTLANMTKRLRASLRVESPYDVDDAHTLYELTLKPIRHFLKSRRIIIVADQTTLPIPFSALIVDNRGDAFRELQRQYHDGLSPSPAELSSLYPRIHWFFNQGFQVSFLPSATSLRILRSRGPKWNERTLPGEPFIGFGDPKLTGFGTERGGTMFELRGASVAARVRALPALPGTREELLAEARLLGANVLRSVYTEDRATKPNLMNLNHDRLDHASVVSFATHALVDGEFNGLREPALVLTPPEKPSDQDVGLLTLDDIFDLRLSHSEWVILSACNTAGASGSGGGFSGLARAFFYAGGHSLLVSQWSVDDRATLELMTAVMSSYVSHGRVSRIDALRAGMSKLMNPHRFDAPGYFAHPAAWAPFFIVGES